MAGVEAERSSNDDTRIGLLAYYQDTSRAAWNTHHEQHDLEDKALKLAVDGVREALRLAVDGVKGDQKILRELLEGEIRALAALVETYDQGARERAEARREHFESDMARWRSEHLHAHDIAKDAQVQLGQLWLNSTKEMQDTRFASHQSIHDASQRAIDIAAENVTARLGEMNQLRQQITAERGTYVTRDILDSKLVGVAEASASLSSQNSTRLVALERTQNIGLGIMLVLVFAIPLGLKFIP
jgi:hypothetical protein